MSDELDQQKRERLQDMYPDTEMVFFDGFDDALIGVVTQFGGDPRVCYDFYRCLAILQSEHKMDHDEALEYFGYNVIGSYVGTSTPCFLEKDGSEWMNY